MSKPKIHPRVSDFPQWYQDVIALAPGLYDESPVTGAITFGPLSTALWQNIRDCLDARLKTMGVENILLPTLIPEHFFAREKEHVEGFAPEVAVVTHAGGEQLAEPYYVRPTSELLFVDWFARAGKIQSHRDLPLLTNQWGSVIRWEKRPRAFLRTTEFHWHEGHCLFATEDHCKTFSLAILDLFAELCEEYLAIPVVKGEKPEHERFPGAITTYTIESMMQDGKALQMGTSHVLSQNFLMHDGKPVVSFLNEKGEQDVPFYDSWAVSTRLIGAIFMAHGDDDGIVIPPRIAPVHATVLPIFGSDKKENADVLKAARALTQAIAEADDPFGSTSAKKGFSSGLYPVHGRTGWFSEARGNLTVRIDERKDTRLGEKTFHQIHSGTPVRIELGARELKEGMCVLKSRIRSREQAVTVKISDAPAAVGKMLKEDQQALFDRAKLMKQEKTEEVENYKDVQRALKEGKWAVIPWDGLPETVAKLKADTSGGTYRCFPFDGAPVTAGQKDPISGLIGPFEKKIIVAKAY